MGSISEFDSWLGSLDPTCLVAKTQTKNPHQDIKQEQYCNKFRKDFKNGPYQKKKNLKPERTVIITVVLIHISLMTKGAATGALNLRSQPEN